MRSPQTSQKPKLLIVDDEPNNLDLLERTFYKDYVVLRAENGQEALQLMEAEDDVAVVISDQQMPLMSGTELLSQLVEKYPDTMRIILTAYTDVGDLVEAINSSKVFKFVTKPFNKAELIGVVSQARDTYTVLKARTRELRQNLHSAEAKYRSIFENSVEGIFQSSIEGRYLIANPMLASIYGYDSAEDLLGNLTDITTQLYVNPNQWTDFVQFMQTHETISGFESQVYRRSKTPSVDRPKIWISESARVMRDTEGNLIGFEGTVQDITQRKRAEEEVNLLQTMILAISGAEDLQSALEIALQKICGFTGWVMGEAWTPSTDGESLECSPAWYSSIDGLEEFREISQNLKFPLGIGFPGRVWQLKRPEWIWNISQETELHFLRKFIALDRGLNAGLAIPIVAKNQVVAIIIFFMQKPNDDDQRLLGLINAIAAQLGAVMQRKRQEAEIYRVNQELALARDRALEASRTKSAFVANMSHELRTPLNAIIGYSEMLQDEAQETGQDQIVPDLKKIHSAGKHLLELINDILDLSKIESGKMDIYIEPFNVPELIEEVITTIRPIQERNGNQLVVECDPEINSIRSDVTKVKQSLFNLLSNACKFTKNGLISLSIERKNIAGVEWISFNVTDTGIGISPDQINRLFREFSQADSSTTRKYGGTGLGLTISQRFCRMLGGDITLESQLGKGSTFSIHLPNNTNTDPNNGNGKLPTLIEVESNFASDSSLPTVLVIDDDPDVHDMLRRFLSRKGFLVHTAPNGKEGIRLAKSLCPYAITLDVMMPSMDGWEVLTALKADPITANIPTIMLTIVNDQNVGYALGAADYLIKPVDRDRLILTLDRYRPDPKLLQDDDNFDRSDRESPSLFTVLIVEDEVDLRQILVEIVEKENCSVMAATNGREALQILLRNPPPHLILLDLMMPDIDGFQFIEFFRQKKQWQSIPIIVITAMDLTIEERSRLNGSVQKVLQKGTYSKEELLNEISCLMGIDR